MHVATESQARAAIAAGGDGLAHVFIGDEVSSDFGEFAASHNAFVIPTLFVLRCRLVEVPNVATDERLAPFLAPEARRLGIERHTSATQGRMPCAALRTTIKQLIAATSAPADVFGLVDRGRIRPGLRADLVLVEGDPSRDILATRNIVAVWKRGAQATRQRYE